jgi:hypothetical protein
MTDKSSMKIGMVGLGRMGASMVRRLRPIFAALAPGVAAAPLPPPRGACAATIQCYYVPVVSITG